MEGHLVCCKGRQHTAAAVSKQQNVDPAQGQVRYKEIKIIKANHIYCSYQVSYNVTFTVTVTTLVIVGFFSFSSLCLCFHEPKQQFKANIKQHLSYH